MSNGSLKLMDAQKQAKLHPETFEVPRLSKMRRDIRQALAAGEHVSVKAIFEVEPSMDNVSGERLWLTVKRLDGNSMLATIDNEPVVVDLRYGDTVSLELRHIIDYMVIPG